MFEICYEYFKKLPEGGYDTKNVETTTKKVGTVNDDFPLDKLAAVILKELARRDIFVQKVIIHEFVKKQISFRETDGGIVIKNRKYALGQDSNITGEDIPETSVPQTPQQVHPIALSSGQLPHNALQPHNNGPRRPVMLVSLDVGGIITDNSGNRVPIEMLVKRAGLQLSANKSYPVFQEMDDPRDKRVDAQGQPALDRKKVYLMWDDSKREITVSADYFIPAQVQLMADKELKFSEKGKGAGDIRLSYGSELSEQMPELRR
jgi:hypothetical protein